MECHKCKKDINESESKRVGPWHFCAGCFDVLMKQPKDQSRPDAGPPPAASPVPSARIDDEKKCALCEGGIGDDPFEMGILTVCRSCYQELTTRPEPLKQPKEDSDEAVLSEEAVDIATEYREMTECHGCSRTIHRVGAKVRQDHYYCPDCFYAENWHASD